MLIGRRLSGRYKIIEVIGGGGMANVYLARDIILERDVAIKILRLDFSNDEEFIKRFRREAHAATSLAHPNIVSIYDVGEEDDIYYIVMEYVAGNTLKQYIQQHAPLHPREVINIMEQLTSAISHAHHNRIVHRDIKPQNILIDHDGTVKVTDFGIAVAFSSTTITQTNSVLGSVHYLSPEQARGGMATSKSDLYSLGIVMFELLTGRVPFSGESAVSIALKHLQTETPSPKRWNQSIPQSIENIILKATAKDPFYRYTSAEEMEEDILTALDPERINEPKFMIPQDGEEITKAIPIITDQHFSHKDDTIVRKPESNNQIDKDKQKPKKRNKVAIFIITTFLILVAAGIAAVTIIPPLLLPKDVVVPDVMNLPYDEAEEILKGAGFKIGEPIKQIHEEIEEGYVIRTNPSANETVKEGQTVTIYESSGKEREEFEDYIGKIYDDILLVLDDYKSVTPNYIYDESEPGTILDQSVSKGELVIPSETEVVFDVSQGPQPIVLEDLTGWNQKSVNSYIAKNELREEPKQEYSDAVPEGSVISHTPPAGSKLKKGDKIEIIYSLGPEEKLPKTVIKTIEIPYEPAFEGEVLNVKIYVEDNEHSITELYLPPFDIVSQTTRNIEFVISPGKKARYLIHINDKFFDGEEIPYPEEE
jgi:eukaryotic-like serine/threonine-protein kinase